MKAKQEDKGEDVNDEQGDIDCKHQILASFVNRRNRTVSVSYTHPDVYKRQP